MLQDGGVVAQEAKEKGVKAMSTKPSNFTTQPFNSVARKSEAETVARNIMVILSRTGDKWRRLMWSEYAEERRKDGADFEEEYYYFQAYVECTESAEAARLFAPDWETVEKQP